MSQQKVDRGEAAENPVVLSELMSIKSLYRLNYDE